MAQRARSYAEKRDFERTPEPRGGARGGASRARGAAPIFVVQRHAARRLHFDFRLEHAGVLASWAVPKGPSDDPADKRLAVRVEDHPLDYAGFEGEIPAGNYGAGKVEIWDRGTWEPHGDAARGLETGELKFRLAGGRLRGEWVLVRMRPRAGERAENWLLIRERDRPAEPAPAAAARTRAKAGAQPFRPQLATLVARPPEGPGWLTEIKYDGYRLIAALDGGAARLLTRNGLDWTARLPRLAAAIAAVGPDDLVLDGELVAFGADGATSFGALQAALSDGRDAALALIAFDLLRERGRDLRAEPLSERRRRLEALLPPPRRGRAPGPVRLSEPLDAEPGAVSREACRLGFEGVVCKRLDAPYRAGRGRDWVKVKCDRRAELVVLGWTPPRGARRGLGALQLGGRDESGRLRYAGGCGTGFSDATLDALAARLAAIPAERPPGLVVPAALPPRLRWVEPVLVAEIAHAGVTEAGLLRHARFLGLREDKPAEEVRFPDPPADADPAPPRPARARAASRAASSAPRKPAAIRPAATRAAPTCAPRLTHPGRALWPGITKADLARYWERIADHALPAIAARPLALLRCPEGIDGEHFFQKHPMRGHPGAIRAGETDGAPWLAIGDAAGLAALAQLSAIELHSWGAPLAHPDSPDRLVFDLDPDPSVPFEAVVAAARDIRRALEAAGLEPFVRSSGGKGLHLVCPVAAGAGWDRARAWSRAFAMTLERADPSRFVASTTRKKARAGRILVDWLRNGLGATAIASFSPRARPGAPVATPLHWREVTRRLDPGAHTLETVPARLARQRRDPWEGFGRDAPRLPPEPSER